ncbi:HNH endonuclease [Salmonella enterica]|nr:HNH endonuclease [Salmonella enterica]
MRNREYFDDYFTFDTNSPTCFYHKGTKRPAGFKEKVLDDGYVWKISKRIYFRHIKKRQFAWQLDHLIYEFSTGKELPPRYMIQHIDGNKDNLRPENLRAIPRSNKVFREEKQRAFKDFKNVLLSRTSPEYYMNPKDWILPESLERLEDEKRKRATGESKLKENLGKVARWK